MGFWDDKNILVTGGAGFIGSHVVDRLVNVHGVDRARIRVPRSRTHDLRRQEACQEVLEGIDVVLHLAANVGGLGYSSGHPADQYHDCFLIDLNLMEAARQSDIEKIVLTSSACAYPLDASYPLTEDQLFQGMPQETNRAYGFAKRMMIPQAEAYHKQYGMDISVVVAANAYGPRDNFDLDSSHVIPALIRKCLEGPQDELVVWGDGSPTRDFLYVEDFAKGVVMAAEHLDDWEPVNIATGTETRIKDLVALVVEATAYPGQVRFDTTKPAGQPKRVLSIERARERMGYAPEVSLSEGVQRTIDWWKTEGTACLKTVN